MARLLALSRLQLMAAGAVVALLLAFVTLGAGAQDAQAHPLGNFTVNRYVLVEVDADEIYVLYVLDMAEIPTFQEFDSVDADANGSVDSSERDAYLARAIARIDESLSLTVGGAAVDLQRVSSNLTFPPGEAGLDTLRIEGYFRAEVEPGAHDVMLVDTSDTNRPGWREVVVTSAESARLTATDAPARDRSQRLTRYDESLLSSPLSTSGANFSFQSLERAGETSLEAEIGSASEPAETAETANRLGGFGSLIGEKDLTFGFVVLALLLAAGWGAMHALGPGHGKTIVAAYLVGSRATARHAAFLGLTVTVTHTAVVFALGLVTLYLSAFILPETLFLWLGVASGAMVVLLGSALVFGRARTFLGLRHDHSGDHPHDHGHSHGEHDHHDHSHDGMSEEEHVRSHLPPGVEGPITLRSLLALGVSGGLIPCPSALLVMLASITLGRVAFGLVLVTAFSIGLAGVLTGVGLLVLYGRRHLQGMRIVQRAGLMLEGRPWVLQALPVIAPVGVIIAGSIITYDALTRPGLFG
ncbi:MAG: high-affinity nickel-transporter [Dehalococcoidia bacterium]